MCQNGRSSLGTNEHSPRLQPPGGQYTAQTTYAGCEVSKAVSTDRSRICKPHLPLITLHTHHFTRYQRSKCLTYLSVQAGCYKLLKKDPVCFSYDTQLSFIYCTEDTDGETWPVTITGSACPRESLFIYVPRKGVTKTAPGQHSHLGRN